jgi:hypothetical protein
MKKAYLAILLSFVILAGAFAAAWFYLPTLAFRMIGRAIGGSVEASRSTVAFRNGLLVFAFEDVKIRGKAEGRIGRCSIELLPSRGIYIKQLSISDFDIKVQKDGGRLAFYPVPVESAEIKKGFFDYGGRKYTVRDLRVTNFNTGRKMEFTLDGGIEGIGDVKTHGEGIFGESHSDIKGDFILSRVNMARVLKDYEGFVDSRGHYSYRNGKLTLDGEADTPRFSIWEKFLLQRLSADHPQCRFHATSVDGKTDLTLEGLSFKGAPLALKIGVKAKKLAYLALTMDFVRIPDLGAYIDFAALSDKEWGPFSYVRDGEVRVDSFVFDEKEPIQALVRLRNASGGDGNVFVHNVDGTLKVNGKALVLTDFMGRFGKGRFYGVSGTVPLRSSRDLTITGRYDLELRDLNRFNEVKEVEAIGGRAEGSLKVGGSPARGFKLETTGFVRNGSFSWKGFTVLASTDYAFADGAIAFDRLNVRSEGTDLVVRGKARKHQLTLGVKGAVEGAHLARLFFPRQSLKGPVGLDGEVEVRDDAFSAKGHLNMTDLALQIPGVIRKGRGLKSNGYISVRGRMGGEVLVDDLQCTVGEAAVHASFGARKGAVSNLHLAVDAPKIERLSNLFFFDHPEVRGDLKADVSIDDLQLPITRLPTTSGTLFFTNGYVRSRSMVRPLEGINLSCALEGERFVVDLSGMRAGNSSLSGSRLIVEGLDAPSFALTLDMTHFDPLDFATRDGKPFRLPVIPEGSLLSRTKGTALLKARQIDMGRMNGRDLFVSATFGDRTFAVNEGRLKTGGGSVTFLGNARLSDVPQVNVTGELKDLTATEAFSLFGAGTDVLDGTGTINGTLRLSGRSGTELVRSASGTVNVSSHDGVVRKWNLVSKLLAVTNLYDLLRGRVDLRRDGLVYRRLSASFDGRDGIFHTNNFLIESPSMIIAGQGDVDSAKGTVDAKMVVSPLVEMDRLIDWIPLVRNVFKEKQRGLIFFSYDVKGPLNDPEITSNYVESMGRRVFNIIWNAIRLPKSLVDRLPEVVDRFPKGLFEK